MPTLFAVVPLYNEPTTLTPSLRRAINASLPPEWRVHIVLIDDGSDSETKRALTAAEAEFKGAMTTLRHERNHGKGAAVTTGFRHISESSTDASDAVVIHDADLEYDPADLSALVRALESLGTRGAALGNRWHRGAVRAGAKGWLHMGVNKFLTRWSNARCGLRLNDMECCYKALRIGVVREILPYLTEQRFGIEPQLVAALAALGVPWTEVPVSYAPRTRAEGKKIGPLDGLRALWVVLRGVRQ